MILATICFRSHSSFLICVGPFHPNQLSKMFSLTELGIAPASLLHCEWIHFKNNYQTTCITVNFPLNAWQLPNEVRREIYNFGSNFAIWLTTAYKWNCQVRGELQKTFVKRIVKRTVISSLILYFTQPPSLCLEFLSCLNKGLNDGWWLRVTHSWHILEDSAAKLISKVNKTTFRHFPRKLLIFINCHILSNIWVQQNEWPALKRRIYFILEFRELLRYSEKPVSPYFTFIVWKRLSNYLALMITSHVSQTKCANFHWNARFFLLNLVCWTKTGVWINSVGLNSNSIRLMWSAASKPGHCPGRKPSLDMWNSFPTGWFFTSHFIDGLCFSFRVFSFHFQR